MVFRRRPLLRGAMVAGAGYYAGSKMQQYRQNEADDDARLAALEAQQTRAPTPAAAPAATPSTAEQLTQLKQLLDEGVLSQAEFDAEKARILRH